MSDINSNLDKHNVDIVQKVKDDIASKQLAKKEQVIHSVLCKNETFYQKNENSNKYKWTPEFAEEVLNAWYDWYLTEKLEIMYTSYARDNLKITFKALCKKLHEFCPNFEDIRDEMDLIITERLFASGATGKLDKDIVKLATKHLGLKWDDKQTLKVEGSVESELEKAFLARKAREANKEIEK